MKGLAITSKGIEDVVAEDISELLGLKSTIRDTAVLFECNSARELAMLAYRAQSVHRVLELVDSFESKDILNELISRLPQWNLNNLREIYTVTATRLGTHSFSSQDLAQAAKRIDGKKFTYKQYKGALHIHVINDWCYVGIDIAGFDLSKRDYKIFPNSFSIRGPLAYAAYRKIDASGIIADPFCRDGTLCIEAALHQKKQSPHFYRKHDFLIDTDLGEFDQIQEHSTKIFALDPAFPNIAAAKKNAKIANVHKDIRFRRKSVDDFDLTFEPESISGIMTSTQKSIANLFERAAPVMKRSGRIAIIVAGTFPIRATGAFVLASSGSIALGKQAGQLLLFEKQ